MEVLFTAFGDVSEEANTEEFKRDLEKFLQDRLGTIVKGSVTFDNDVNAEVA